MVYWACRQVSKKNSSTLNYRSLVLLDDLKTTTTGDEEKHRKELFVILEKFPETK